MKRTIIYLSLLLMGALNPLVALAQTTTLAVPEPVDTHSSYLLFSLAIAMVATILFALLSMAFAVMKMMEIMRIDYLKSVGKYEEPAVEKDDVISRFFNRFGKTMIDIVPLEQEASIDLGHDYDGIRELDNNLPPWWTAMFIVSIIFAAGYLYYYHLGGDGKSVKQLYEEEVEDARMAKLERLSKQKEMVNEETVKPLTDAASLEAGKATFVASCVACHGANAEGNVGPNLTDEYWIHGGGVNNVFKSVKYGWPAKGMISWESQLSPRKMQEVASYILSLKGTNPPNAKAPQGDIYVPAKDSTTVAAPTDSTKVVSVKP